MKNKKMRSVLCMLCGLLAAASAVAEGPSLVERLGFPADAKLLIINADDFGMNHATNQATIAALKSGGITSATMMVPCGWFPEAVDLARANPQAALGVHTVLTSEWRRYRWAPVLGCASAPSLCDPQGYMHSDVPFLYLHADIEEADREVRAQIDKALAAGIDVTHIDSHMGAMQYAPGYHERYLRIAKDYNLPCRVAGMDIMAQYGGERIIKLAAELGVLHPDILFMGDPPNLEVTESWWKDRLAQVQAGKVTELYIHCGELTPEMRATTGSAARRTADTEFFSSPATREYMRSLGIELISYRELRHLQREGAPMPRAQYGWE